MFAQLFLTIFAQEIILAPSETATKKLESKEKR